MESLPPVAAPARPLRFLVVDDDRVNRVVLRTLLEHAGHEVIEAADGGTGVSAFAARAPDMVLLDIMMPGMDGYEAARRIRSLAGERFVPVIFLTALNDDASLRRCIDAGGDDFLTKPFNRVILESKIRALLRVRGLTERLAAHNAALHRHQQRLDEERRVAEQLFRGLIDRGCLNAPFLRHLSSPAALFNGDVLLAARRPAGGLLVLAGDFAGHGLRAAVGVVPVAEMFYAAAATGLAVGELVAGLNTKIKDTLPTGLFLAAAIIEIDAAGRSLAIWNGGLPDALVCGDAGGLRRLGSRHPPLGVLPNDRLVRRVEIADLGPDDRVLLYTDGVIEARNAEGLMFGAGGLEALIAGRGEAAFDAARAALAAFGQGTAQHDDMTLLEIRPAGLAATPCDLDAREPHPFRPAAWQVSVELDPQVLRQTDVPPLCLQLLASLQGLHGEHGALYTIMAELVNNALDHGLLRLDSTVKGRPGGFAEYYARREQALERLADGHIRIEFRHRPHASGGRLTVIVEDSGPGFELPPAGVEPDPAVPSGRGLALVRSLAAELRVARGRGGRVEAVYDWR